MEEEPLALSAETNTSSECKSDQPGASAIEALIWTIAHEFVTTMDEFHDAVLNEDESDDPPKVQTAGK
jgi:hypothetical protein